MLIVLDFLVATHCKAVATQQQGINQKCWHSFKAGIVSFLKSRQNVQNTSNVLLMETDNIRNISPRTLWPAGNVDEKSLLAVLHGQISSFGNICSLNSLSQNWHTTAGGEALASFFFVT